MRTAAAGGDQVADGVSRSDPTGQDYAGAVLAASTAHPDVSN